jgi:uncharacterized coiled-coil protein SlyX
MDSRPSESAARSVIAINPLGEDSVCDEQDPPSVYRLGQFQAGGAPSQSHKICSSGTVENLRDEGLVRLEIDEYKQAVQHFQDEKTQVSVTALSSTLSPVTFASSPIVESDLDVVSDMKVTIVQDSKSSSSASLDPVVAMPSCCSRAGSFIKNNILFFGGPYPWTDSVKLSLARIMQTLGSSAASYSAYFSMRSALQTTFKFFAAQEKADVEEGVILSVSVLAAVGVWLFTQKTGGGILAYYAINKERMDNVVKQVDLLRGVVSKHGGDLRRYDLRLKLLEQQSTEFADALNRLATVMPGHTLVAGGQQKQIDDLNEQLANVQRDIEGLFADYASQFEPPQSSNEISL